jgi:integrase
MAAKTSVRRYIGVYYTPSKIRRWRERPDRCYWVGFREAETGKLRWERCGWASEGWTPEAAQRRRHELLEQDRVGEYKPRVERKQERITFGAFMESRYLPWTLENQKCPRKDHERYRKWLAPRFADKPISLLSPLDLERLKKEMGQAGMSDATIRHVLCIVRQAINKAIHWGLWEGSNPCSRISFPKPNNARMRFLTREEAEALLKALREEDPDAARITTISLYGGLRLGEVLALKWVDVNEKQGIIHVMDTKTNAPRPTFIEGPIREVLSELTPGNPDEPLFKTNKGAPDVWMSKLFKSVVDSLGFNDGVEDPRQRVYFHTLRHTFASWAVMAGVPLYTVGKALGHKTASMTQRYAHLAPESQREAFEAVAGSAAKTKKPDGRRTKQTKSASQEGRN